MSEIHGAVGAYVVNALEPDEREEFEAHLAVCPTCSREVVEFGETAAELSVLASALRHPRACADRSLCHLRGQATPSGACSRVAPTQSRLVRRFRPRPDVGR